VKRRELIRHLERFNCVLAEEGAKHSKYVWRGTVVTRRGSASAASDLVTAEKGLDRLRRGGRCLVYKPQAAAESDRYEALGGERYSATLSRQGAGGRNCLGCFQAAKTKKSEELRTVISTFREFSKRRRVARQKNQLPRHLARELRGHEVSTVQ